jgi:CspA family cold shock protein
MERGTVKMFSVTRGFGFITPDDGSPDIFLHANSLKMSGIPSVAAGDRVEYERVQDNKGWQAYRVARV